MSKVLFVTKRQLGVTAVVLLVILLAAAYFSWNAAKTATAQPQVERTISIVTGEFKTTKEDGKELEVYTWQPGNIPVMQGEAIKLQITGVNGASHPFIIEGLGVRGEVKKGEVTEIRFTAERKGIYAIQCLTHTDMNHGGPMVGYIVVQ
ncbi:cupredoxin domain-containing protein [Paenibacillus sp. GCM10023252]|uniref:cupredoxin domain-containing protein n=1 Tax=Paenibacillus sp. GCM10023252 TaxID=3252649 RepID=UPI003621278C